MISRDPIGFVLICPHFHDMAMGRTAHGLQASMDAGLLCHFQQSTSKYLIYLSFSFLTKSKHCMFKYVNPGKRASM